MRYRVRSGCGWRKPPVHFGPSRTVHGWFRELARRFLFQTIRDDAPMLDREHTGREASPAAAGVDSQAVEAPHENTRGYGAGKTMVGRKHHIAGNTDGRLPMVHPDGGRHLRSAGAQAILDAIRKLLCATWQRCRVHFMGNVLAYMTFPKEHRAKLHSTNPIERVNGEIKRRTEVVGIFPNDDTIIRLVGPILLEQNDEWAVKRSSLG